MLYHNNLNKLIRLEAAKFEMITAISMYETLSQTSTVTVNTVITKFCTFYTFYSSTVVQVDIL